MLVTGKRAAIKLGSAGQRSGREDDALPATWRRIQPMAVVQNAASTLTSHTGYAMGPVGPKQCLTAHALDIKISAHYFRRPALAPIEDARMEWETDIGLAIHAQLSNKSKIFS